MADAPAQLWTINELGTQAALALSVDYAGSPNGRVREIPDRRTIRYYTTLGIVDRPLEMQGRSAFYGQRHLLQLVAIKRLQAQGFHANHVHPQGWISSCYYVALPDAVRDQTAQQGWIKFGEPSFPMRDTVCRTIQPVPSTTGPERTRGCPSISKPMHAPTISTIESTAPTS